MSTTKTANMVFMALGLALSGMWTVDPAMAFRPKLPPAGDCRAMAASGIKNIWYGEFSGRYEDTLFRDGYYYPISAQGCFVSEYECRRWTNQLLSITESSGLMRCRPYRNRR